MKRLLALTSAALSSALLRMKVISLVVEGSFPGDRQLHRQADDIAGGHTDFALAFQAQVGQTGCLKHVDVVALVLVHDLEAVHVLDPALGVLAVQHAVLADVEATSERVAKAVARAPIITSSTTA